MKKLLLLAASAFLFTGVGFAQKNNGNGKGNGNKEYKQKNKDNSKYENKNRNRNWDDENDNVRNRRDDDRYERRDDDRYERRNRDYNTNGKETKNAPAKVRQAFNRDFPNARNYYWTKDRGYWTAHFDSGVFNSNRSVTYKANGERVNNTTGIFGRNEDKRRKDDRNDRDTRKRSDGVLGGILNQ